MIPCIGRACRAMRVILPLLLLVTASAAAQGTIRGVVTDSLLTRAPLQGATVILQGAPNTAVTDRLGRFVMREVPAGTYSIGFFHPVLDSLEATAPVKRVEVRDDATAIVALGMPTANTLSNALCGRDLEAASAVVFGVVRDAEGGAPLPGAVVRANWYQVNLVAGVARETQRFEADTARADGRYVLCGVPNDIALTMRGGLDGQVTGDLHLALDHLAIGRRDVMVSRTDTAARPLPLASEGDSVTPLPPPGTARLRVLVTDQRGRPVADATVGVRGTRVNGKTDAEGRVRLVGIPAGSQTLLVRRPGAEPVTTVVPLRANAENELTSEIGRSIVILPAVAVTGQAMTQIDREIAVRLRLHGGKSFDEKALEKAASGSLGFWTQIGGVRVIADGFDAQPYMQNSQMLPCRPNLWYNGARIGTWTAWELRTLLIGAKRMEVYPRPSNVPPAFTSIDDCGAIAIWS